MSSSILRRLAGVVFAAATLFAAPAALAGSYTVHRIFTSPTGVTGTAVLELDDSTLIADTDVGNDAFVPAELLSATLTFNNIGGPVSTTFTRNDLTGFRFARNGADIWDINFWSTGNADGYTLEAGLRFTAELSDGVFADDVTNRAPAPAPAPVPTLSEWAMIGFALALAGGAALMIQRRRLGQTA